MPASPINTLSQTDLQRLLDAVPVPLFIKNASGEVLFLNQTWRALPNRTAWLSPRAAP